MFFNNFINNIIKSMMAVCAVTNGWSMGEEGETLTANPSGGGTNEVLVSSNSGNATRSWANVVKGNSPKVVNTDQFGSKGSDRGEINGWKEGNRARKAPDEICDELLFGNVAVSETLRNYLDDIKSVTDEEFAEHLAYPLLKHLASWENREELKDIKMRIYQAAKGLNVILKDVTEDNYKISLKALCEYAEV